MSHETIKKLDAPDCLALRCAGADWPRGLWSPTLIPDAWMGLLVKPDGRRWFVPSGEDPRADDADVLVLVRNRAITVPLAVVDVPAADNHEVSADLEILARVSPRDDELAAFAQVLLGGGEFRLADLSVALEREGTPAILRSFIRQRPAAVLVNEDQRAALLAELQARLQRFLFSAGMVLERLGKIEFASGSLRRQTSLERDTAGRVREIEARGLVERTALAATQRRLDDLGSILGRLRQAAGGGSDLRWRDLLPTLTPGERGRLLASLWRLTPDRATATAIVVVAGQECVWLEPQRVESAARRVTVVDEAAGETPALPALLVARRMRLGDDLGGLRSVRFEAGRGELLVGAARGVWRLNADSGATLGAYAVPGRPATQTGFNGAVIAGDRLVGTHSQLGAWSWALERAEDALGLLRPAGGVPRTVRAPTALPDGGVVLAADDRAVALGPDGAELWRTDSAGSSLHCLALLEGSLYAGTAAGALLRCEIAGGRTWAIVHREPGAIESIQARRWDDLVELVVPAGTEGVRGMYVGEGLVATLLRASVAIRRAWAGDDMLVALSETRDRLVVLGGSQPEAQGREVPLARLLGCPIQDADIITRAGQAPSGAEA